MLNKGNKNYIHMMENVMLGKSHKLLNHEKSIIFFFFNNLGVPCFEQNSLMTNCATYRNITFLSHPDL